MEEKEWTIMVYMAGDNNLSADMAYALADIREVMKGRGDKLNMMVYYDGAAVNAPTLYCDFTDFDNPVFCPTNLVEKAFKHRNRRIFDNGFDENSGAVYTLMNFVNWCVNDTVVTFVKDGKETKETHYGKPAKKYALIFSGHASAFQNMSLMVDATSDYYMTIPRLRWALEQIAKKDPPFKRDVPLLKQKIDILGFDSCVMGMAELAYEFQRAAKTMVASEGNLPSAGWSYGCILSELIVPATGEAVTDEKAVAAAFVEKFIEKESEFLIGGVSVDLSALDLDAIDPVIKNINNLGKSLDEILQNPDSEIASKLQNAIKLTHLECQSYMSEQNVDVKDFCEVLLKNISDFNGEATGLAEICGNIIKAVDDCVLMSGFSGGTYQYSNGLSIFLPWTNLSYLNFQENYESLQALGDDDVSLKDWNQFLLNFTSRTQRPARPAKSGDEKVQVAAGNGFAVSKPANGGFYFPAKNTHIGNDKNTHIGNDKNTHIGNDKNTHIGNDKGLQQFLLAQFKNTFTPWYIAGFTKLQSDSVKEIYSEIEA